MLQLAADWLLIAVLVAYGPSLPFGVWLVAEARRSQVEDRLPSGDDAGLAE